MSTSMRAVTYTHYGGPEVLRLSQVEQPSPKAVEILLRVRAVEVTKGDCELRSFRFPVKWFWLPLRVGLGISGPRRKILGTYFAGTVESAGSAVTRFKPGDDVFGCARLRMGAYAEYMTLPAGFVLAPKPKNMSFEEAAAVPLGGLNALHFMRKAAIRPGEQVLINGSGGSIGLFGVQLAKSLGAEVTAVDSALKQDLLCRAGADHVVDYAVQDFSSDGPKYDVVFDMVAGSSYGACMGSLKKRGRYLKGNPRLSDMLRAPLTSAFTSKSATTAFAGETQEELSALKDLIEAGTIQSFIDRVYPMEQVAEAHRRVESEQRLGHVVMTPS